MRCFLRVKGAQKKGGGWKLNTVCCVEAFFVCTHDLSVNFPNGMFGHLLHAGWWAASHLLCCLVLENSSKLAHIYVKCVDSPAFVRLHVKHRFRISSLASVEIFRGVFLKTVLDGPQHEHTNSCPVDAHLDSIKQLTIFVLVLKAKKCCLDSKWRRSNFSAV